jgi:hypothetical protein
MLIRDSVSGDSDQPSPRMEVKGLSSAMSPRSRAMLTRTARTLFWTEATSSIGAPSCVLPSNMLR